jgi:hypothetical protein
MPSADRAPIADAAPPPPSSGPTARVPLGRVFGTRSGDKGGNANLGIWARAGRGADAAYAWLAHELTVDQLRALFPDLAPYAVDRAMLPNLHAVNFTIRGILGDGVAASTRSDPQAKTLGEYVRARIVELPVETAKESTTEPRR